MKHFLSLFAVSLLAFSITASSADAIALDKKYCDHHKGHHLNGHHGARYHHGHGRGYFQHVLFELDLTDDQKKQIREIQENSRSETSEQRKNMRILRKEMRAIVLSDNFNEERMRKLAQQKADQYSDLIMAKAKMKNRIYLVLSDKQKLELKTRIDKFSKIKKED